MKASPSRLKRRDHGARHILRLLALRLSNSNRIDGLWIGTLFAESEPDPALRRVEEALRLIKEYDRLRYNRLIRDLERVWVRPLPGLNGRFRHSLRICELDPTFVLAETSLPEVIASVIVHEATHARLRGCGIGYAEGLRPRVEAVCIRRELAFAAKLPNGQQVREQAEQELSLCTDHGHWTDAALKKRYFKAHLQELRNFGVPEWLLRLLLRVARFRGWREDERNGHGVETWVDGSRYEGEFRDDNRNGHGVFAWPDGGRYEGAWRDDKRNGHGVETCADGRRYEGEWRDGNQNGHGVQTWTDGSRYEGEWRDGEHNGCGVLTRANGGRYEGEWRDDKRNGHGILTRADGSRYEGEWRDGNRNGHGVQAWADSSRYEGEWRDGKPLLPITTLDVIDP